MNVWQRFKRLNLWNKIFVLAAIAAFISLLLVCVDIIYNGDDIGQVIDKVDKVYELCKQAREDPRLRPDILASKYPLGYAILIIDGNRYTIERCLESNNLHGYDIHWKEMELLEFTQDMINIKLPTILIPHGSGISDLSVGARRAVNHRVLFIDSPGLQVWFEMLINEQYYSVGILGLSKRIN